MIALQDRQLVYEFLKLDLAIRSLQHDLDHMQNLKCSELYMAQYGAILLNLQQDFQWRKKRLASKKIRLNKWIKVDEYYSDAILATSGEDAAVRFSAHALKQSTQDLISQYIMPIILQNAEKAEK